MKQNSTVKQQSLRTESTAETPHAVESSETSSAPAAATSDIANTEELDAHVITAAQAADDKKAIGTVLLDLRSLASFTDYFLITSGTNVRQVQAIADAVVDQLKKQGRRAARVEGYNSAEWVLVDYGDFIVHIFEDKARRFYDLERLWREATPVKLPSNDNAATTALRESESNVLSDEDQ